MKQTTPGTLRRFQTAWREALTSQQIPSWRAIALPERSPKAIAERRAMRRCSGRIEPEALWNQPEDLASERIWITEGMSARPLSANRPSGCALELFTDSVPQLTACQATIINSY